MLNSEEREIVELVRRLVASGDSVYTVRSAQLLAIIDRLTTATPTESVPPRAYQAGRMLWQKYPFTDDWHGEYLVDGVRRERRVATDDEAAILALLDEAAILASRTTTTPSAPASPVCRSIR